VPIRTSHVKALKVIVRNTVMACVSTFLDVLFYRNVLE